MDWQLVSRSLRAMDTGVAGSAPAAYLLDEDEEEQADESEGDSEAWRELEQLDLEEGEAQEVFAAIETEKSKNKRSWAENRVMKAAVKKDRSGSQRAAFGAGTMARGSGSGKGKGKGKRLSISELKLISRCANCGQRGHWRAECPNPYKARGDAGPSSGEPAPGSTLFVFDGARTQQSAEGEHERLQAFVGLQAGVFATWTQGTALVDTGAAQDVIGEDTYMRLAAWWAKRGVFPIELPRPVSYTHLTLPTILLV
eukprot:4721326-Amphidinium_carterae.1